MEEEIKVGEQERENLRIETQRLRDELGDLRVEAEIMQDKLRKRQLSSLTTDITAPSSPAYDDGSPASTASSPMITTPPDTKSISTTDTVSETPTPPSPPMSESSTSAKPVVRTPMNPPKSKLKLPTGDSSTTPKPAASRIPSGTLRSSRDPTAPTNASRARNATPAVIKNTRTKAPATRGLPNSQSLTHIRTLTAQMQRLEQRVQSARSKLPAPVSTPPRASPRNSSAMSHNYMPPSVTIRSRKRTVGSTASTSSSAAAEDTPSTKHVARLSTSGISRLSFGPLPNRSDNGESRPSSRASASSFVRPDRPLSRSELSRPVSRTSMTGARTPLGHYSQSQTAESRRPRSSIGYAHGHSQSVSNVDFDETRELDFATPSRRSTIGKSEDGGLHSAIPRRKSGGIAVASGRRTSSGALPSDSGMKPPGRPRKLSGVGETY